MHLHSHNDKFWGVILRFSKKVTIVGQTIFAGREVANFRVFPALDLDMVLILWVFVPYTLILYCVWFPESPMELCKVFF